MLQNTGIKPQVQQEICEFAQKHNLDQVILFGSRARGNYHHASDIDLAVRGGDTFNFAMDIDEETSTMLCYDVIDLESKISDAMRESIGKDGRVLYEKV